MLRKRKRGREEEEEGKKERKREEERDAAKRRRLSSSPHSSYSSTSSLNLGYQITPTPREMRLPKIDPFSIDFFRTLKGQERALALDIPDVYLAANRDDHALIKVDVRYQDSSLRSFFVKLFADFRSGWYESGMVEFIRKYSPEIAGGKVGPISHGRCVLQDPILSLLSGLRMKSVEYCSISPFSGLSVSIVKRLQKISPIATFKWEAMIESIRVLFVACTHSLRSPDEDFWFEHGDTNPENYLVDDDGTIRMIDFGNSSFGGFDQSIRGNFYYSPRTEIRNGHRDFETLLQVLVELFSLDLHGIDKEKRKTLCSFFREKLKSAFADIVHEFDEKLKEIEIGGGK
jgi:hypothetical protein